MFEISFLTFACISSLVSNTSAQIPMWNCTFGEFGMNGGDAKLDECGIQILRDPHVYWFITGNPNKFNEPQPYFRASLNNHGSKEGNSTECILPDVAIPDSGRGILSFQYLLNSNTTAENNGSLSVRVCKDEVYLLPPVAYWGFRQIRFNCSTEAQISFRAVRGYYLTNAGIDNVSVVEDPLTDWYCTFDVDLCKIDLGENVMWRRVEHGFGGYLEVRFNDSNSSINQSEIKLSKDISVKKVQITYMYAYYSNTEKIAEYLEVVICGNISRYRTNDPTQIHWQTENIVLACESNNVDITFIAKRISSDTYVWLDYIRIYDLSETYITPVQEWEQPTSSCVDGQASNVSTPTSTLLASGETKTQTWSPTLVILIASSVIGVFLLCSIITALICRRNRSRSKPTSSQESDEDDTGLVINQLYGAWGDSPPASDVFVGDHAPSSGTNPDTLDTNVDTDFEDFKGDSAGDLAGTSTHDNMACGGNTYHTLEASTKKDSSKPCQALENEYEDIEDKPFRSLSDKTTCYANTYYTLEVPSKTYELLREAPENEYDRINFPTHEDGAKKHFRDKSSSCDSSDAQAYVESRSVSASTDAMVDHQRLENIPFKGPTKRAMKSSKKHQSGPSLEDEIRKGGKDCQSQVNLLTNKPERITNIKVRLSEDEEYDTLNFGTAVQKSSRQRSNGVIAEEMEKNVYGSLNIPDTTDPPNSPDIPVFKDNLNDEHVDPVKCHEGKPMATCVEHEATYQNI